MAQVLAGLTPDAPGDTLLSTVGLASLGAVVMASLEVGEGNIDSVMCSTAYVRLFGMVVVVMAVMVT